MLNKKSILSLIAITIMLSACQTHSSFIPGQETTALLKPGLKRAQMRQDYLQCQINAAKEIPPSMQTRYMGGMYTPGQTYCSSAGYGTYCNTYGGMNIPATMNTYDANEPLRQSAVELCLTKKGYSAQPTRMCDRVDDFSTEGCVVPQR